MMNKIKETAKESFEVFKEIGQAEDWSDAQVHASMLQSLITDAGHTEYKNGDAPFAFKVFNGVSYDDLLEISLTYGLEETLDKALHYLLSNKFVFITDDKRYVPAEGGIVYYNKRIRKDASASLDSLKESLAQLTSK